MKVLVCGGRDFTDIDFIAAKLTQFHQNLGFTTLISGAAAGVDTIAEAWAEESGIPTKIIPALWKKHGRSAGPKRNEEMLKEKPDIVLAFPGGTGTAHMVGISLKAGLDLWQSKRIYFTKEDRATWFLSNFAEGFEFHDEDGLIWRTSEHYYQAHKTPIEHFRGPIQLAKTASLAKKLGQHVVMFDDWKSGPEWRCFKVMRDALRLKFAPGSRAAELLLETGDDYLIEYAPWGDPFWGVDRSKVGSNYLGVLLMERRENLRA